MSDRSCQLSENERASPRGFSQFDEGFPFLEELQCLWQRPLEKASEIPIRRVPDRQPQDPGRSSPLFEEPHEILVLGEDDDVGGARRGEDLGILSIAQSEVPNVGCLDSEPLRQPRSQLGRQLSVDPDDHAATTG